MDAGVRLFKHICIQTFWQILLHVDVTAIEFSELVNVRLTAYLLIISCRMLHLTLMYFLSNDFLYRQY